MRMIKKLVLLIVINVFLIGCSQKKKDDSTQSENIATESIVTDFAKISLEEEEHDFGDIMEGDVVSHTFNFTNTGSVPLQISGTETTCGCTTPEYTKRSININEKGTITVEFDSKGKQGIQNKQVRIKANIKEGHQSIKIKANVIKQ